jgi:hypothetical protein
MSKSLATAAGFVTDALKINPTQFYKPEDIRLGEYTFVSWVRSGLGAIVQNPAAGALRATVRVTFDVEDDKGGTFPVDKTLTIRGPGDVIGINAAQFIRRFPTPGAIDADADMLAHVEFDRPELPWLFTPREPGSGGGVANARLDPWLVLVVLESRFASFEPAPPGFPPRVRTRLGELQPLEDSWAFAHAQVVGNDADGPSVSDRLTSEFAPVNLSRLLCPRKLDDNKDYVACVVPAIDCGVRIGLGQSGGTLGRAWTRSANDQEQEIVLPVYDHWEFSTKSDVNFEELAGRLFPIAAPWSIGRRIIDMSTPRGGLAPLAPDEPGAIQVLKCALVSPNPKPPDAPDETAQWSTDKREELRAALNRPDEAAGNSAIPEADLPRVGPRIYARFQKAKSRVDAVSDSDWFQQLNTTPTDRIVSGLGTRVVEKDQEQLMQAAWAQVGAIDKANRSVVLMQYARFLGESVHRRNLQNLDLGTLAQVAGGVLGKIRMPGSSLTVAGNVARSFVAPAAVSATFRRAARPRGPIARFYPGRVFSMLQPNARSFRDFRRPYAELDGVRSLSAATVQALSADVVARALKVPAAQAMTALNTFNANASRAKPVADRLLAPRQTWTVADQAIDPGALGAAKLLATLQTVMPTSPASDAAASETVGSLIQGVAGSGLPQVSARAGELAGRISSGLPSITPAPPEPSRAPGVLVPGQPSLEIPRGRVVTGPASRVASRTPLPTRSTQPRVPAPAAQPAAPAAAAVNLQRDASVQVGSALVAVRAVQARAFADALYTTINETGVQTIPALPDRASPEIEKNNLLLAVHPRITVTRYAKGRLGAFPSWLPADWLDNGRIDPIMTAPVFTRAMYEALDSYDRDWLVPGLGSIAKTDFVTLLETNPRFTESFLVGLSDEMGRELLWRGYPTDQRGTYFNRFWDETSDELSQPIHRFSSTPLSTHIKAEEGGAQGRIVLVVRGTLVKRYPDAIVMAMWAQPGQFPPKFFDASAVTTHARILFHAHLPPDIILVGFDLTAAQVQAGGWWFVISEHPTAPRFGLDTANNNGPGASPLRNNLDWGDLDRTGDLRFLRTTGPALSVRETTPTPAPQAVQWPPSSSAVVTRVLLQNPIRAAFDGLDMLNGINGGL